MRLNPVSHPVGTRVLLQDAEPGFWNWALNMVAYYSKYEATVLEWSPTARSVKLKIEPSGNEKWLDFMPWVVEKLAAKT